MLLSAIVLTDMVFFPRGDLDSSGEVRSMKFEINVLLGNSFPSGRSGTEFASETHFPESRKRVFCRESSGNSFPGFLPENTAGIS